MRSVLVVVLATITSLPAVAGDVEDLLVGVAKVALNRQHESHRETTARWSGGQPQAGMGAPARSSQTFALVWGKEGITDASEGYWLDRRRRRYSRERLASALVDAGRSHGLAFLADSDQTRAIQDRSSERGFDPRTAPTQGLMRAPDGTLIVTITHSGYSCEQALSAGSRWGRNIRLHREEYEVAIEVIVASTTTGQTIASSRVGGSSASEFVSGETEVDGIDLGGLVSKRARPDEALARAAQKAMGELACQLFTRPSRSSAGLVVADMKGSEVVIMTTDGSDVRDAGVVEGFRYSLRGTGIVNPVTGQPSRGSVEIGEVEVFSINADLCQARLLPGSAEPEVGDRITLVPYQSLH